MDLFQALILGIIQGITEWLPLSSSGHLVIAEYFLGVTQPIIFDVLIQLGSVLVVIVFFYKELMELAEGMLRFDKKAWRLGFMIVAATIPAVFFGYFFSDFISSTYKDLKFNGICFLITALLLFLSRYPKKKEKSIDFKAAWGIGFAQALSILPAVSRSGATISTGMIMGYKREEVARFSFLILIPVMIGASVFEISKGALTQLVDPTMVAVATITATVTGFFSLNLLMKMIKKDLFSYFSIYCLILGIILLII